MKKKLEEYLIGVIEGKKTKLDAKVTLILLSLLEYVYLFILSLRQLFYHINIFKSKGVEPKVISVGNITLGGTGKTPVVEKLARSLKKQGKKVVIISRGYRSEIDKPLVVSDGKKILVAVKEAGDEVYMLASHLPEIGIVTGKDRYQACQLAQKKFNPDIIILDDGFQHWQLKRDKDIVVIDVMAPFGKKHALPRGFLREPLSALRRADVFVLSKTDHVSKDKIKVIKKKLKDFNKKAEIIYSQHQPLKIKSLTCKQKSILPVEKLKGKQVLAFSGIGNPQSFINSLQDLKAKVIDSLVYPDHYHYQEEDLMEIAVQAQISDVDWVITTEKDAVKFNKEMLAQFRKLDIGLFTLGIELKVRNEKKLVSGLY